MRRFAGSYAGSVIEFRLSVDVLGNTRFAFSPLAEVGSSLRLLGSPHAGHVHQPWLREVRERLQDVDLDLLCAVAPPGRWAPDFLFPPAASPQTTIEDQLSVLTRTSVDELRGELEVIWSGRDLPRAVTTLLDAGDAAAATLADAVWDYWQVAIAPYWPRICAVLEDDVAYRAGRSVEGGLFELLADLHPEVSLGAEVLRVDKPHHADATYDGAELTLVPSVFVWPNLLLSHAEPAAFELTYAARGVGRVWEGIRERSVDDDPLAALLGRSRSAILQRLDVPLSTTQLARELGQSPAGVSQHLAALKATGLVTSRRSGRSVLYRQTPLAASVLATQRPQRATPA